MIGRLAIFGATSGLTARCLIASTGDDRNALIMLTVQADFGAGKAILPGSRLYLLDNDSRIESEHVVFYTAQCDQPPHDNSRHAATSSQMRPGRLGLRTRAATSW